MNIRNTMEDLTERAEKIILDEEWNDIAAWNTGCRVQIYNYRTDKEEYLRPSDTDETIREKISRSYIK